MVKVLTPIVGVMMLAVSMPALAQSSFIGGGEGVRQRLDYDSSALNTAAGRRDLDRRISMALRNVCGDAVTGTKEEIDAIRACRTDAEAMARAQLPVRVAGTRG